MTKPNRFEAHFRQEERELIARALCDLALKRFYHGCEKKRAKLYALMELAYEADSASATKLLPPSYEIA